MKKFISLILSIVMLTTCCGLPSFAVTVIHPPNSSANDNATFNFFETSFINKLGFTNLAKKADAAITSFKTLSLLEKSFILSAIVTIPPLAKGLAKTARSFYVLKYFFGDSWETIKGWFKTDSTNLKEPEEALHNLGEELKALKGQKEAKERINSIVAGIIYEKEMAKLKNKKYDHGDVIYMSGPSGCGKTFSTEKIANALSCSEPFTISASEVDLQDKHSVVRQLFNFNDYYGESNNGQPSRSLVRYIRNNKNGVVIINEYDKMWNKALDEVLRTIVDQGIISIGGNVLDCSGITFIITSNESSSSVNGGNQDTDKIIDDGTGSRTSVNHDKSFMNRVKLVEFENLKEEDYAEIIKAEYNSEFFEYWEKLLNIKFDLGDTVAHVAKKVAKENKGARIIKDIFNNLINKLIILKSKTNSKHNNDKTKDYVLSYDENTDDFSITLKSSQAKPDCFNFCS